MAKRVRLTLEDLELQRRVKAALDRVSESKRKRAEKRERQLVTVGSGASFLLDPSLPPPPGGAHTDLGGAGGPDTPTSPTLFLPSQPDVTTDQETRVVWSPQAGPQHHMIQCPVTDVVIGGSRGGGKSQALIGDAAIRAGRYGSAFRGLFLRRQQTELLDVKAAMREIYTPLGAHWNEQQQTWTFPGGGQLILKYLMNDDDAMMYKGWNLSSLYVDEIGDFPSRKVIDLLWGAMRSAKGIPITRRMSCNPGGPGHQWVKQLYLSHGPYRVFRYAPNDARPDLTMDAVFIPAKLEDNPLLLKNNPQYEVNLAAACGGDQVLYRAWRYGDWDGLAGTYFNFSEAAHVAIPPPMAPYLKRWIGMDWGYAHPSAVVWFVEFGDRAYAYRERLYSNTDPVTLGRLIAEVNMDEPIADFYLSPDAFARRTSEQTIAMGLEEGFRQANEMRGCALLPEPSMADNDRVNGWQAMAAGFASGRLFISPECSELVRVIQGLVRDPKKPNDVLKVDGDDVADATRYGWATRRFQSRDPLEVRAAKMVSSRDPNERAMQERLFWSQERRSAFGWGAGVSIRGGRVRARTFE